jgi:hypothetical protein
MTTQEIYQAVLLQLRQQKTSSITPSEFNTYARIGIYEYFTNRFADFEKHQKTIDDLQAFVVITDGVGGNPAPLTTSATKAGEEFFALPLPTNNTGGQKMFLLDVQFGIPCTVGELSELVYHDAKIKHQDSHRIQNVYDMPDEARKQFFYLQHKNGIRRVGGKTRATKAIVKYLSYPPIPTVNTNTGLTTVESAFEPRVAREVVNFIVSAYLEATMSPRQQTFGNERQKDFNQQTVNYK